MPFILDDTDIAILKLLKKNGRKSFRQISREIKISVPTIIARYNRLVNVGLIKSVSVVLDLDKIEQSGLKNQFAAETAYKARQVNRGTRIALECDFCHGPISGKPVMLKFANYERYLCCTGCRKSYKEKYKSRIEALSRKFEMDSEESKA